MGLYSKDGGKTFFEAPDEYDTKTGINKAEVAAKAKGYTKYIDVTKDGSEIHTIPASEYNVAAKKGYVDAGIAQTRQKAQADFQNEANSSAAEAFALGVGKGVTFNNIEELAGAGAALTGGSYTGTRDINRDVHAEAERERPWTYGGGELVGNVLGSIGFGKLLGAFAPTAGLVTKAPTLAGNIANIAKVGGMEGALMGAGGSEADLTKGEVGQFAKDTALSGIVGTGAGALGAGVVAGAPKAYEKARTFFSREGLMDKGVRDAVNEISGESASKLVGEGQLINKIRAEQGQADAALEAIKGQAGRQQFGGEKAVKALDDAMAVKRNASEALSKDISLENTRFMKYQRPENKLAIQELRRMTSDEAALRLPELQSQASQRFRDSIEAAGSGIDSTSLGNLITSKANPAATRYMEQTAAGGTRGYQNEVVSVLQDTVKKVNNKLSTNPDASVSELYDFIREGRAAAKRVAKQSGAAKPEISQIDDLFFGLLPEDMAKSIKAADVDYSKFIKQSNAIKGVTGNAKTTGAERYLETADGITRVAERVGKGGALKAAGENIEQLKQVFPELTDAQAANYGKILKNSDDPVMLATLHREGAFEGLPKELIGPIEQQAKGARALIQNEIAAKQAQKNLTRDVGQNLAAKQSIEASTIQPAKDIVESIGFQGSQSANQTTGQQLETVLSEVKDQLPQSLKDKFFDPVTGERLQQSIALTQQDVVDLNKAAKVLGDIPGFNDTAGRVLELPGRQLAIPLPGGGRLGFTAPTAKEAIQNRARSFEAGQLGMQRIGQATNPVTAAGLGRVTGQQIGQSIVAPEQLAEIEQKVSPAARAELKILKLRPASSITPEVIRGLAQKHGLSEDEIRLLIGAQR